MLEQVHDHTTTSASDPVASESAARDRARQRLQVRRDFGGHAVAFVVVNAFLIGAWALTGAGYFWPAWILAGWGVGLVLHAWDAFARRPVTEQDVDAEVQREHRGT